MSVSWHRKRSSCCPLPRLSILVSATLCCIVSLIPGAGVRFPFSFVLGFVAKTQDPSSLAPRFEGFTVPALPNVRKNRNARLLCPVRAVRCCLDHTAAHRPRCERLFVTAGRSKKEISKTTVSFWLWKTISRAHQFSGTEQPVPAPRARETRGIAPSLLFKKNFAVDQVLKVGTWRRHTTFTRHLLRDLAHRSLDTFHLGPVVAAQALVYLWPARLDIALRNDSGLTFDQGWGQIQVPKYKYRCKYTNFFWTSTNTNTNILISKSSNTNTRLQIQIKYKYSF